MGIKNLLQQIPASATKKGTTKNLEGLRIAIDGHCLLHRCCMFAAKQVMLENNLQSTIDYLFNSIEKLLRFASVNSFLVFDGGCLLAKSETMERRLSARDENMRLAREEIAKGSSGWDYLMKAFHVTDEQLVTIANEVQTRFPMLTTILSPGEADGELAYLCCSGLVDAVFSVDADLLLYGVPILISKFDAKTEELEIITSANVFQDRLKGRTHHDLVRLGILAGCDYVSNMRQFGWAKIWKYMLSNDFNVLRTVTDALVECKGVSIPVECATPGQYARALIIAAFAFTYHVVYDLWTGTCVRLYDIAPEDEELFDLCAGNSCGTTLDNVQEATKIVTGAAHGDAILVQTRLTVKRRKLGEKAALIDFQPVSRLLGITKIEGGVVSGAGFSFDVKAAEEVKHDEQ